MGQQEQSINKNLISTNDAEIDLKVLFKLFIRNKKLIGSISAVFFLGSIIFSYSLKKVWQGQFQIVLSEKESQNLLSSIDPRIQTFLGQSANDDLETQVGILESPSVLMPIFEYVSAQKMLNGGSELSFINWKNSLTVELKLKTSILDVAYKDTDIELILPVLRKISEAYQDYSGKKEKREQELLTNYLNTQISIFRDKSFNSFKLAQEYAFDQNLLIPELPSFTSDNVENSRREEALNSAIPNIALENLRVNTVNEIKRIDANLKNIRDVGNDFQRLQYISTTLPEFIDDQLTKDLEEIEKTITLNRSVYKETDPIMRRNIETRSSLFKLLKNRIIGYLEEKKVDLEAKMESVMRPKDVITKYKEFIREANRDETTLIELENQLRIVELEAARQEDPWQLITDPTLLKNKVSPSRKTYGLVGLSIGLIGGTIFCYFKEKKSGIIYNLHDLEGIISIPNIYYLTLEGEEFKKENINLLKAYVNQQIGNNIKLICVSNCQTKLIKKLKKSLVNVNKEIILFDSIEVFKNIPTGENVLVIDGNSIKYSDINYLSKYFSVLDIDINGLIVFDNC